MKNKQLFLCALLALMLSAPSTMYATEYRVLVVVTPSVKSAVGSSNLISTVKQYVIGATNAAYNNSSPSMTYAMPQVELAGILLTNYTESGSMYTDLERLQKSSDSYMDEVHIYRDNYAADIVMLFTNHSGYSGLGYLHPDASYAFQLSNLWYVRNRNTVAHENGHIFGCTHDVHHENVSTPYTYGHGYLDQWPNENWGDIMSYAYNRQPWFSNPYESHLGVPRGDITTADCSRVHYERGSAVASFRDPVSHVSISDTVGDGEYAGVVSNSVSLTSLARFQAGSEGYIKAANQVSAPSSHFHSQGKLTIEANNIFPAGTYETRNYFKAVNEITNGNRMFMHDTFMLEASSVYFAGHKVKLESSARGHVKAANKFTAYDTLEVASGARLTIEADKISTLDVVNFETGSKGTIIATTSVSIKPGLSVKGSGRLTIRSGPTVLGKVAGEKIKEEIGTSPAVISSSSLIFTSRIRHVAGKVFLEYALPEPTHIRIRVYRLNGSLVGERNLGSRSVGLHSDILEIPMKSQQVYLLRIQAGRFSATHQVFVSASGKAK